MQPFSEETFDIETKMLKIIVSVLDFNDNN